MKIVCVLKSGGDYHPKHVYALRDMCQKWMPPHTFVCLTDLPGLACDSELLQHDLKGWWSKLELFRAFRDGETLFMDLDTVVRGPCTEMLRLVEGKSFVILRDFYRLKNDSKALGSGLMFWRGDYQWLFELFMIERPERRLGGDQNFIEYAFKKACVNVEYWQDFTADVCSFKVNIRNNKSPSAASIVCFHGIPRPWNQSLVPYPTQHACE